MKVSSATRNVASSSSTRRRDAASLSSTRCRDAASPSFSARSRATPVTSSGDDGLVVAETPSEHGNDSAYSLVVRSPLSVTAVYSEDFSASHVAHVHSHRCAASLSGVGQKLLEVGEFTSNNYPQEVGYERLDGCKELAHKTDVRLVYNSTDITNNGANNCMVWLNNESIKAYIIWNTRMEVGFSRYGSEEDVLNGLRSQEEKDNRKEGLRRGGLKVVDNETD